MPEYETLPPIKVLADALVKRMVPVPVTVRLVDVEQSQPVVPSVIVHVPEPIFKVLTAVPEEENAVVFLIVVKLYVAALNVPDVKVRNPIVNAS